MPQGRERGDFHKAPEVGLGASADLFYKGLVEGPVKMACKGAWEMRHHPKVCGTLTLSGVAWNVLDETSMLLLTGGMGLGLAATVVRQPDRWRGALAERKRTRAYERSWEDKMLACGLGVAGAVPRLRETQTAAWGERVRIELPDGLAPTDVRSKTAKLAWTFGQRPQCRVKTQDEMVWLEFSHGRMLRDSIPAPPIPEMTNLEAIRLGMREDGEPWNLRILHPERGYKHLFVAGESGAGKSGVFWQAIREMVPGLRDGTLELRVADPKFGVEFSDGEPLFTEYAETEKDIAAMLHRAAGEMEARAESMKARGVKQHTPRVGEPAVALFIDEFPSLLRDCSDRKLAAQMERDARLILRLGRVFGMFIWAATQDPRIEGFPLRPLFTDSLGLRVAQSNQVDMIFGKGSRDAGVTLDLIDKGRPGTGFEITDDGVMLVRSFHVTKEAISELVTEYGQPKADPVLSLKVAKLSSGPLTAADRAELDARAMTEELSRPLQETILDALKSADENADPETLAAAIEGRVRERQATQ